MEIRNNLNKNPDGLKTPQRNSGILVYLKRNELVTITVDGRCYRHGHHTEGLRGSPLV